MSTTIRFENFEGPLDLLLNLLEKDKVDILDIPIAEITEQYNAIIQSWDIFDLEEASDYILMAARLLQIKSKMLLPKPRRENEEDPREELANQLILYAAYKKIAKYLEEREQASFYTVEKDPEYFEKIPDQPPSISLKKLERSFRKLLENLNQPVRQENRIVSDKYTVEETKKEIVERLTKEDMIRFRSLLGQTFDTEKVLVSFLAVLELFKVESLDFRQDEREIIIFRTA